jgi:hypothetical protein
VRRIIDKRKLYGLRKKDTFESSIGDPDIEVLQRRRWIRIIKEGK